MRFDLVRASPALLFAGVRISYTTRPTRDGIHTRGAYTHRLIGKAGEIEFLGRAKNASHPAPPLPDESGVRVSRPPPGSEAPKAGSRR